MPTNVIQAVQGDALPDLPYTLADEASGVAIDLSGASGVSASLYEDTSTRQLVSGWPRACAITAPASAGGITIPMQAGDTAAAGTFDFEFTITWVGGRTQTTVVRALFQVQANPNQTPITVTGAGDAAVRNLTVTGAVTYDTPQPWVNVLDYRRSTDTDDSAAFQRAHDGNPQGTRILIPVAGGLGTQGRYQIGTPIVDSQGMQWEGSSSNGAVLHPTHNNDIFVIGSTGAQCNGTRLLALMFQAAVDQSAGAGIHIVWGGKMLVRDVRCGNADGGRLWRFCQIDRCNDTDFMTVKAEASVEDCYHLETADGATIVELFWDVTCSMRNAGGWGLQAKANNTTVGDIEGLHIMASIYKNTLGGVLLFANGTTTPNIKTIHLPLTVLDSNGGDGLQTAGTGTISDLHLVSPFVSANAGHGLNLGQTVRDFNIEGGSYQLNGKHGVNINGAQRGRYVPGKNYSNSQSSSGAFAAFALDGPDGTHQAQQVMIEGGQVYNNTGGFAAVQAGGSIGANVLDIDIGNTSISTATKWLWAALAAARVRVFRAIGIGSNIAAEVDNIGSGTQAWTLDGFGSLSANLATAHAITTTPTYVSTTYSALNTDGVIYVTAAGKTITLPPLGGGTGVASGRIVEIKNAGSAVSGTILAPPAGASIETTGGAISGVQNTTALSAAGAVARFRADNTAGVYWVV